MQQAVLPAREQTQHQLLKDIIQAPDVFIEPPNIITADGVALIDRPRIVVRMLQNIGTSAVYVGIDPSNNPNVDAYHFVLAAGTAANDGLGGQVDLSRIKGTVRVTDASGSGTPRVATLQAWRA